MTISWLKLISQKCKLCAWWRLETEQLFSYLNSQNSIEPPSYKNRNNPQCSFQCGTATINFPQYPKGELNSGQGNKGTKLKRNKPPVFFRGRFLATFKWPTSLFAYTTVMANGATMLVIWKTRELHSPSFTLLFCLAFSDFLVGLLGQPLFVAFKSAELLGKFDAYCKLRLSQFFIGWITGSLSFVIVSGVSFDRLLSLKLHLRYKATITVPRVLTLVASILVSLSILTILKLWLKDNWIIIPATIFSVTSLVTAVSTFQIFQIARKHQRQIFQQNQTMGQPFCRTVDVLKCKKSAVTVLYVYGLMLALAGILSSVYFSRHEWSNIRCYTVSYSRLWRCHSHSFYKLVVKSFHLLLENGTNTICCQKYS